MSLTPTSRVFIPLRILQSLFSTITLALCIYIQSGANSSLQKTSQIVFLIFTTCISLATSFYLVLAPAFFCKATSPLTVLFLSALNSLLYLIGFIAEAVSISKQNHCNEAACLAARVLPAFAAFGYISWVFEVVIAGMAMSKVGQSSSREGKDFEEEGEEAVERDERQEREVDTDVDIDVYVSEKKEKEEESFSTIQLGWA